MKFLTYYSFKSYFYIFLTFTLVLLIEGFFYYFSHKLHYSFEIFPYNRSGFNPIIWNENGIVETLQIFFLIISIIIIFSIINKTHHKLDKLQKIFIYIYLLGIIYFFLEEISWGQHYFKWESGQFFTLNNHQKETNLHNTYSIFNDFPRLILTIWCGLAFILSSFIPSNLKNIRVLFFSSDNLKYISFLLLLFFIPDLLISKFNLHPGNSEYSSSIILSDIYDFFSFNYIKLSEYHELVFCFYILNHSINMKNIEITNK